MRRAGQPSFKRMRSERRCQSPDTCLIPLLAGSRQIFMGIFAQPDFLGYDEPPFNAKVKKNRIEYMQDRFRKEKKKLPTSVAGGDSSSAP